MNLAFGVMTAKRLYLVDAMSLVFRAYYALPPLSNSKGLPTNAIYGFTTMLRKLINEQRPDYLAVAADLEGPTVRHLQYAEYKAQRKPMPDPLAQQMPYIWRVCQALRVPVLAYQQYEADDVIGTLARKAAEAGLVVFIVTADKDMYQLVSERILILDTRKEYQVIDAKKVEEKLGVPPERIVDLLGLCGDATDNIPGAPGIGEKGARELIRQFGSIENLLANCEKVQRKAYRESLKNNAELIRKSRELVRINTDLPIELNLAELVLKGPDRRAACELFSELEFTSLIEDYLPDSAQVQANYEKALTGDQISRMLERCRLSGQAAVAVAEIAEGEICVAVAPEAGCAFYLDSSSQGAIGALSDLCADVNVTKIFHDLKRAKLQLDRSGLGSLGWPKNAQDLMLAAYLLDPNRGDYSLERIALERLGRQIQDVDAAHRCCQEADLTLRLATQLLQELREQELERLYREIELPLVQVLAHMETVGVRVDVKLLEELSAELEAEIEKLTDEIYRLAGAEFNINSPKQLGEMLFEKLKLPVIKRTAKTGSYSTDVEVLEELAESHRLPQLILDYRQLSKLKGTYVDALAKLVNPATGRVHTSYNQAGTATGRLSSSEPNFQNIPVRTELGRKIRAAIIAEEGSALISADYSQIELRIMAHLSEDPVLVEAFMRGEDIHERTAMEVFGPEAEMNPAEYRRRAKVINFGVIYGLSPYGLAKELKISKTEAQKFIDEYFRRYRGVRRWIDATIEQARRAGIVRTLFGRIRQIPDINSSDHSLRQFAERTAINSPIQGTAADLIKIAMVNVYGALRQRSPESKLILQVHDELVFEVPEGQVDAVRHIVKREMESVCKLRVPLTVDVRVGRNWRDVR